MNTLNQKTLIELADMLARKDISCSDIAAACIERYNNVQDKLNAFITFNTDNLTQQAKDADARRSKNQALSKYDGIPVAVKDNMCTKGMKTTCASGILRDFVPPYDATVISKLKALGFIIAGKTNLDEFAMGSTTETSFFGPTKNPHDLSRVPGGSSGGSAAAVASNVTCAALGSDTGGSVRQPAAFCGVVGLKPTYGNVSRYGLVAYASSLDQIGVFAGNTDDACVMYNAIQGHDAKDSTSVNIDNSINPKDISGNIKGVRIGIPEEYFKGVNADICAAVENKIKEAEKAGAIVKKISLKYTEYAVPIYYLIATAETSSNLARYDGIRYGTRSKNAARLADLYENTRSEGFGKEVKRRIILGTFALSSGYYDAYYLKALKGRSLIISDFRQAFEQVDAIVTPVSPVPPFKLGEKMTDPLDMYLSDILTISANLAGIPGISIPVGKDNENMPVGLQIMCNHFKEKDIFNLSKAIEKTCEKIVPNI